MDDFSPRPVAPSLDRMEADLQDQELDQVTKNISDSYFHPAWAAVEQMFNEVIDECSQPVDERLLAEEFKIKSLANQQTKHKLLAIWGRVKDAVSAIEGSSGTEGGND